MNSLAPAQQDAPQLPRWPLVSAILPSMNSINHTIHGLASSLLLNVGLTKVAQKLDPVSAQKISTAKDQASPQSCVWPCNFTPTKGQ